MDRKISVVINTYNASRYLEEVLRSVIGFDQVVICDMDSTDDTLDIVDKFAGTGKCKVVNFPKGNHKICEPARDFAIHSADCKWVLVVDADEVVPDALRSYLYARINEPGFDDAIALARQNLFMGKPATASPDYQLRFFQKDKAYWPPIIHARPQVECRVIEIPAKRKDLYLYHLDNPTIADRIAKMNNYTDYEVVKRYKKPYGTFRFLFRPLWFFMRSYIFGKGFMDGKRGLIRAYMAMIYQATYMAKITEKRLEEADVKD